VPAVDFIISSGRAPGVLISGLMSAEECLLAASFLRHHRNSEVQKCFVTKAIAVLVDSEVENLVRRHRNTFEIECLGSASAADSS
jgi:hypothetical protein